MMANDTDRLVRWQTRMREFQQLQRPDCDGAAAIEAIADIQWKLRVLALKLNQGLPKSTNKDKTVSFEQGTEQRKTQMIIARAKGIDNLVQDMREQVQKRLINRAIVTACHRVFPAIEEFEELLSSTTGVRWHYVSREFREVLLRLNTIHRNETAERAIDQLTTELMAMRC